ncbi:MAG: xanthine dehydrogenase accessory factor [Planctomycetota bacterium]|jgi:xanthine dehydrogenase accessory factor
MEDIYQEITRLRNDGMLAALATIVDRKGSTPGKLAQKMVIVADGRCVGTIGGGCVEADVIRAARHVMDTGLPQKIQFRLSGEEAERTGLACGGVLEIMIECLNDPALYVFGCGHVGKKIAMLASHCGFHVTAIDDRPDFADPKELPNVHQVQVVPMSGLADNISIGANSYVVSATRGHDHDFDVLLWALQTKAKYIGILGSKSKWIQFRQKLDTKHGISGTQLDHVHCPVGMPIGADTPDEIAVSVVADLIAQYRLGKGN